MKKILVLLGLIISSNLFAATPSKKPIPKKKIVPIEKSPTTSIYMDNEQQAKAKGAMIEQFKASGVDHANILYKGWMEKNGIKINVDFTIKF